MYSLPLPTTSVNPARRWLMLGVTALGIAGVFALLLVGARTPSIAHNEFLKDVFHVALVVHVDLSVLVWFLAVACMLWCIVAPRLSIPYAGTAGWVCFAAGTALISVSPFTGNPTALMSNYIPVIDNLAFHLGLAFLAAGVVLSLLSFAFSVPRAAFVLDGPGTQTIGLACAALTTFCALLAFAISSNNLPEGLNRTEHFEKLFWGGGHLLQFTHTLIMMVAWLWLASAVDAPPRIAPKFIALLYVLTAFSAVMALRAYSLYPVDSGEHREFFTRLMIHANGVAPILTGLMIIFALFRSLPIVKERRALWMSLIMSLLLFFYGGALGFMIQGVNVTIPAHYHGSIVGVTLAFMGLTYLLLPSFGYAPVSHTRLAFWQPIIYGGGQILHISGLAWSGGYGVLRKTPGALESGFSGAKAAMGLMGGGGMLAIIGGLIFVIVVIRSVRGSHATAK